MRAADNLFSNLPLPTQPAPVELFQTLLSRPLLRIERIVSTGQASAPGYWYDQPHGEWVLVLSGEARLRIDGEADARVLNAGDWADLPPHCRHRVDWTHPSEPTIWLAVHYAAGTPLPPA